MSVETSNLRLRATRRDYPDMGKLIEWVLNIAETRHRAWINDEPDPYGLPPPDSLLSAPASAELFTLSGVREKIDTK